MAQNKRQERLQARRQKERQGQMRNMALIGVAAVAIVGWIAWTNFRPGPEIPPRNHPMEDGFRLGNPDAPVVLEEFGDFLCGHCQDYYMETSEAVIEQYVATGDVYYIFHALPYQGLGSQITAEASYCAGDQGRFWDFHDELYNEFNLAPNNLAMTNHARDLGLDVNTFNECMDSGAKTELVQGNVEYASGLGVTGTPAFVINGRLEISGAQPFSTFQQTIDSLLASSN
ncbi:MAG: DsbA family protein [Chloroflexi bacterium]|nr:MAG: DsbA family protein [Chloroflexota bacterium]MBL1196862.1 DsbA family protein [Chloroflexota bacterium]NOH14158.1 DsbA family protein [Chloroflexota bacterium]